MNDFFVFIATGKERGFTSLATTHLKDFRAMLKARKNKPDSLITLPARVRFVHFKWETQEILLNDQTFTETGNGNEPVTWTPLPTPFFIDKSEPPAVSIVDIYHAVRNAPPQSVLEVSIFSHGFVEGPALQNSDDDLDTDPPGPLTDFRPGFPRRFEFDLDGRVRTDFFPNMGEDPDVPGKGLSSKDPTKSALEEFRGGFAPGAAFRVFGCDLQTVIRINNKLQLFRSTVMQVIREAYYKHIGKNTAIGLQLRKGQKPSIDLNMRRESEFEFSIKPGPHDGPRPFKTIEECLALHYSTDDGQDGLFEGATASTPIITRSYQDIIRYVARQVQHTYTFAAAKALAVDDPPQGITCFGALPGTSADLPEEDPQHRMIVDRKQWDKYLRFYKEYLQIDSIEAGAVLQRNYGVYNKAAVESVEDHVDNG